MIYDFDSSGAVVLTTPEPGAFLNFRWESADSSYYFIPQQTSDVSAGKLWINGLDISLEASIYDDTSAGYYIHTYSDIDSSIASFFLYTREFENFDVNLQIDRRESSIGGVLSTYDISVLNRPYIVSSEYANIFEASNIQIEGETSYLILRTNPKFSGNVKLVIDPSDNLFMDTFKVSDILSNKLYRKQKISGNGVFQDITDLEEWSKILKFSRCGLGHTAANPITSSIQNFRYLYEQKVQKDRDFDTGFNLADATRESCDATGRTTNY